MQAPAPSCLSHPRVRLEPLGAQHLTGLTTAAADGKLWRIRHTSVPDIEQALAQQQQGTRLPFAVIDPPSGEVVGSTSDIGPAIDRLDVSHPWYARRMQRTHLSTCCKWLLPQE